MDEGAEVGHDGWSQRMLYIILWSVLFFGASTVMSGVMRSSGSVLAPTLLSISAIVLIEVPVAWFASRRIGVDGVWWAYPCTFAAMAFLQATYYRLVWRRRKIERLI